MFPEKNVKENEILRFYVYPMCAPSLLNIPQVRCTQLQAEIPHVPWSLAYYERLQHP